MQNIRAIISEYSMSSSSSLVMCAPVAIYLHTNYPKQYVNCERPQIMLSDGTGFGDPYKTISFAVNSYSPHGDNIFFQIFPLGAVNSDNDGGEPSEDFDFMKEFTSRKQDYINYPSMTITPSGTLINSPVFFDTFLPFINNGIYSNDQSSDLNNSKNTFKYTPSESSSSAYINWQAEWGAFYDYTDGANPQNSEFFQKPTSNTSSCCAISVSSLNFGTRKSFVAQKKQTNFSYVQCMPCSKLGTNYNSKKHICSKYLSKRIYNLSNYMLENPLEVAYNKYYGMSSSTDSSSSVRFMQTGSSKPFLFIINFSNNQDASANLDFGFNRIEIYPDQLFLTVSDIQWFDKDGKINKTVAQRKGHSRRAQCSTLWDKNTQKPYFYSKESGLDGDRSVSFIVYPVYCGIAIQPGIHFPSSTQSSQQAPVLRGIGSVVQMCVPDKKRAPTLQTWLELQKVKYEVNADGAESGTVSESDADQNDGNMFLQPHPANWVGANDGKLRLTLKNCTANFFYMPLYFVSKCRFRMYFKGIKAGKYTTTGKPAKDQTYYSTSQSDIIDGIQCESTSSSPAIQYAEQPDGSSYSEFASHSYYGSVIYTTNYRSSSGSGSSSTLHGSSSGSGSSSTLMEIDVPAVSYITTPVSSYRIPPVLTNKKDTQFWDKYSMDGYYFDFIIDMSGVKKQNSSSDGGSDNSSSDSKKTFPFIRQTIQVLGVLVLQVTNYKEALLRNGNGNLFKITQMTSFPSSSDYKSYDLEQGQLAITSDCLPSSSSCNTNWEKYIQNISVNWNQQGGSGSITLDKYALMGQQAIPQQYIGNLRIKMIGGNPNFIGYRSDHQRQTDPYPSNQNRDCIFSGFGTKMSTSDSISSDTITIQLEGPQRKLSDLKLINPPFWDGDLLITAYTWMSKYCGIQIHCKDDNCYFSRAESLNNAADSAKKYIDSNGKERKRDYKDFPRLPTSANFKRPFVYIKNGQDAFSVLKKLAEWCNCRFVLQPDGQAYVMTQSKLAVPIMCDETQANVSGSSGTSSSLGSGSSGTSSSFGVSTFIDDRNIISYSVEPLLNNLHNYIITASFKSAKIGSIQGLGIGSIDAGIKTNKKFKRLNTNPDIPWAKVKAFKHQGYMSQKNNIEQFEKDSYMVSSYWLSTKITIPGIQGVWIYDLVTIFGIKYYVTDISHNIDLVNKKWTTQLTLSNVLKDNNLGNVLG